MSKSKQWRNQLNAFIESVEIKPTWQPPAIDFEEKRKEIEQIRDLPVQSIVDSSREDSVLY
jgi:hypothetical protein